MKSFPVNFLINSSMERGGGRVVGVDDPSMDGNSKEGNFKLGTNSVSALSVVVVAKIRNSLLLLLPDATISLLASFTAVSGF